MGGGAISMVLENRKLFVACLSGFWRFETKSFSPEQKMLENVSRQNQKNGGNDWAGPPTVWSYSLIAVVANDNREQGRSHRNGLNRDYRRLLSSSPSTTDNTDHPDPMPTRPHHGRAVLLLMGRILLLCAGREGGEGGDKPWFVYVFLCVRGGGGWEKEGWTKKNSKNM
jgi:hypothetical protein